MKICNFAGRMKKFLMNISSAVLVIWYCVSIIGFGVHTCVSSGETFIATFADGMECVDIHPEHHCCGASCCSGSDHDHASCCSDNHHEGPDEEHDAPLGISKPSCCSNDYQAIVLSGCRAGDDSKEKYSFVKAFCPCVTEIPVSYLASARYPAEHVQFLECDSGFLLPGEFCATFGVWRI